SWNGIDVQKKAGQTHDYSRRRPVSEWSKRELRRHYPHCYPWSLQVMSSHAAIATNEVKYQLVYEQTK
ncbi:unnamed protein product, partial [Heterotrigona itama]